MLDEKGLESFLLQHKAQTPFYNDVRGSRTAKMVQTLSTAFVPRVDRPFKASALLSSAHVIVSVSITTSSTPTTLHTPRQRKHRVHPTTTKHPRLASVQKANSDKENFCGVVWWPGDAVSGCRTVLAASVKAGGGDEGVSAALSAKTA